MPTHPKRMLDLPGAIQRQREAYFIEIAQLINKLLPEKDPDNKLLRESSGNFAFLLYEGMRNPARHVSKNVTPNLNNVANALADEFLRELFSVEVEPELGEQIIDGIKGIAAQYIVAQSTLMGR